MKRYKASGRSLTSPKPLYAPGEEVTMVYDWRYIGTDTDYYFSSDDVEFSCDFEQGKGYVIRFIMPEGQTPREEGLILAQGMVLLGEESSPVIPGSLKLSDDGIWEARFEAGQVLNHAFCDGDFDFYLGGTNTEGRTFAGLVIIHFES